MSRPALLLLLRHWQPTSVTSAPSKVAGPLISAWQELAGHRYAHGKAGKATAANSEPSPGTRSLRLGMLGSHRPEFDLPDELGASLAQMDKMVEEMDSTVSALARDMGLPRFPRLRRLAKPHFTLWPARNDSEGPLLSRHLVNELPVDVREYKDKFVLTADVAGLSKEDVKVRVSPEQVLEIEGERESESESEEGDGEEGRFHRIERPSGAFRRNLQLPEGVDPAKIQASVKNGELRVVLPKLDRPERQYREIKLE